MALRGNLRDFTITQLLNLINLASKTGTLVVDGASEQAFISFREGKLAYARVGREDGSLAAVLHKANKINANQYRAIADRAGQMTDKELGLLLINAGYVTQEDILLNLQGYFTDVVRRLFTWVEGIFRFENEMLPPDDRINVKLDLENIIIEGSRQLRELEQLKEMEGQGLVVLGPEGIEVTAMGWYFVRGIAMVFDRYLQADKNRARFSRII